MEKLEKKKCRGNDKYLVLGFGLGICFGGGIGIMIFAITGNTIWLSIGPGMGVAFGPAIAKFYSKRCKEESELKR